MISATANGVNTIWTIIAAILSGGVALGAVFAGLGYMFGQVKKGSNQSQLDTMNLAKGREDRLEKEINDLREALKSKTNIEEHLVGQVKLQSEQIAALQLENTRLQKYVRLEEVPPAIIELVTVAAGRNHSAIIELTGKIDGLITTLNNPQEKTT